MRMLFTALLMIGCVLGAELGSHSLGSAGNGPQKRSTDSTKLGLEDRKIRNVEHHQSMGAAQPSKRAAGLEGHQQSAPEAQPAKRAAGQEGHQQSAPEARPAKRGAGREVHQQSASAREERGTNMEHSAEIAGGQQKRSSDAEKLGLGHPKKREAGNIGNAGFGSSRARRLTSEHSLSSHGQAQVGAHVSTSA